MNDVSFVIGKFSDICEVIDREYADSVSIARLCRAIKANLIAVKDGGQSLENSSVMDDIEDLFGEIEQYDFHKVHDTGVLNQIRLLFLVMALGKANQEQYDEGLAEVKSNEDKGYIVRTNNKIEEDEEDECEYDEEGEDEEEEDECEYDVDDEDEEEDWTGNDSRYIAEQFYYAVKMIRPISPELFEQGAFFHRKLLAKYAVGNTPLPGDAPIVAEMNSFVELLQNSPNMKKRAFAKAADEIDGLVESITLGLASAAHRGSREFIQFETDMEFAQTIVKLLSHVQSDQHSEIGRKLAFLGLGLVHANNPGDFEQVREAIANLIPKESEKDENAHRAVDMPRITLFDLPKGMDF